MNCPPTACLPESSNNMLNLENGIRHHFLTLSVIIAVSVTNISTIYAEEEWPEFRGPTGQGHVSSEKSVPVEWSETKNIAWKTPIPGEGHSSPVITGNQIWLTTAITQPLTPEQEKVKAKGRSNPKALAVAGGLTLSAIGINRDTGKIFAEIVLFKVEKPEHKHTLNSFASPTPIIKNGKLYCHFGSYGTACVNLKSQKVEWRNTELVVDHMNGPGSSPALWENYLICNFDGADIQFIAAIDINTNKIAWKTPRSGELRPKADLQKAYCTPLVAETENGPIVISPGADWVYGYEPKTGKELWRLNYGQLGFSTVPRPVFAENTAYICTSFTKSRLIALKVNGKGDVTETHKLWHVDKQIPKKTSPLLVENRLHFISDDGVASCLDTETGKPLWKKRVAGNYSASPILVNGNIYYFSHEGKSTIIQDSGTFEEVASNSIDEGVMASPAVVDGKIYLRGRKSLYCISEDKLSQ